MSKHTNPNNHPNGRGQDQRPLLLVDVDGVISLFGFDPASPPRGTWLMVDGIAHLLSATAGAHLTRLASDFELAWCTGWEEKADEYLPHALKLEERWPHVSFTGAVPTVDGHWKLDAIDRYAGSDRAVAWIDDAHDERCEAWAERRPGPTLLVTTDPPFGLTDEQVELLLAWATDQPAAADQPAATE
jgi:HAD domain in Swiss Army Knife RNA repair proteins